MCGISGSFDARGLAPQEARHVRAMSALLTHRGPDQEGLVATSQAVLGSKRLAIVDPSEQAIQPFTSPDGNVVLVCNGEIYNAPQLRRRYAGRYPFRSDHNDVEPVLALYLDRGEEAIAELDGMFGLAIHDARAGRLLLARDRAGEKPLFYAPPTSPGTPLRFASEIQALLVGARAVPDLCQTGLAQYLALGYTLAPHTVFEGIAALEAGQTLVADRNGIRRRRYWDACAFRPARRACTADELRAVIERAVAGQTAADVPVGVFLSGGVDSSLLATEVVRVLPASSVHTYVARFERAGYDESPFAAELAARLGTRHHEVDAGETALLRALRTYTERIAQPVGDPALLPAIVLAEAAAADVKVVLSGEGADELFGGYPTYLGHLWAQRYAALPGPLRRALGAWAGRLPRGTGGVPLGFLLRRFVEEAEKVPLRRHLGWFGALGHDDGRGVHEGGVHEGGVAVAQWDRTQEIGDAVARAMRFDLITYLAENLFTKIDRATMLAGIEARAPLVGRDVMELALAQPVASAVAGLATKRLFKTAAAAAGVPSAIVARRKRGLSVPVGEWLCGALREEADELLAPARLERLGLDPAGAGARRIGEMLREHRSARADHARKLWPLLSLQLWYERWVGAQADLADSADPSNPARACALPPAASATTPGERASPGARSSVTR